MICWNDFGGHWQTVIGYDTMGTEETGMMYFCWLTSAILPIIIRTVMEFPPQSGSCIIFPCMVHSPRARAAAINCFWQPILRKAEGLPA